MTARITTMAAAARIVGVTQGTIRLWREKGWLADPPWTPSQVKRAAARSRQAGGRGSEATHGTPSRWRAGCACPDCGAAHNADLRQWRQLRAIERWAPLEGPLCDALANGAAYRDALADLGLSATALTAHRRRSPDFAARIDQALMDGRDPDIDHGAAGGWKHGCRCPDCRSYHEETR